MALEKRGNSTYYYRSVRQGKKVKRKYIAAGEDAELAAAMQDHRRVIQQITRERIRAHQETWENAFGALTLLGAVTDVLFKAVLLSKGFHRRHQGEWRRRREKRKGVPKMHHSGSKENRPSSGER